MAFIVLTFFASFGWAAELEILFPDLKSQKGGVAVVVFPKSAEKTFPDGGGHVRELYEKLDGSSPFKMTIPDLPEDEYALAAYHDEDGDRKLARDWLGIPAEPFGFSNNPRIYFGAPSFRRSSFLMVPGKNQLTVKLKEF